RLLDREHRSVDAGAVAARRSEQDALVARDRAILPATPAKRGTRLVQGHSSVRDRHPPRLPLEAPDDPGGRHWRTSAGKQRRTAWQTPRSTMAERITGTPDEPWSVERLGAELKGYIGRLGHLWVEGEITQWSNSRGNVFG